MKRLMLVVAFAVPVVLVAHLAQAQEKKPAAKADVTVKAGTTTAKAKVGQTIELQLPNTPPPEAKDITVTVDGDAIDKVTEKRGEVIKQGGKAVSGKGSASVVLKAKAAGTSKVKVEYTAGDKKHTHEYTVEVVN
jgi:hypothetical protein